MSEQISTLDFMNQRALLWACKHESTISYIPVFILQRREWRSQFENRIVDENESAILFRNKMKEI